MKNIVWLASYPKSGNTWFRVILANILLGLDHPASIQRLSGSLVASSRRLFDEFSPWPASTLTDEEIRDLRPEVIKQLAAENKDKIYLKIHDAFDPELVPRAVTSCVLYFVRNPLDIAVSFAHHLGVNHDQAIDLMNQETFGFCDRQDRLEIQLRQYIGTWSHHVRSWLNHSGLRIKVVRYEDMVRDTFGTLDNALSFCGLKVTPDRLERAIRFSSFEEVCRQEREFGFAEKSPHSISFFRAGRCGDGELMLKPDQMRSVIEQHKVMMRELDYMERPDLRVRKNE